MCEAILTVVPRCVFALVAGGSAYGHLLNADAKPTSSGPYMVPHDLVAQRLMLIEKNNRLITAAEALGWRPSD